MTLIKIVITIAGVGFGLATWALWCYYEHERKN